MAPGKFGDWLFRLVPSGGILLCALGSVFLTHECCIIFRWLVSWCWLCAVWIWGYHILNIWWSLICWGGICRYPNSGIQLLLSDTWTGGGGGWGRRLVWLHQLCNEMESRQRTRFCLGCFFILPSVFSGFWLPCQSTFCWYSLEFLWGGHLSFYVIVVGVSCNL